jgi:hypothetical protein
MNTPTISIRSNRRRASVGALIERIPGRAALPMAEDFAPTTLLAASQAWKALSGRAMAGIGLAPALAAVLEHEAALHC